MDTTVYFSNTISMCVDAFLSMMYRQLFYCMLAARGGKICRQCGINMLLSANASGMGILFFDNAGGIAMLQSKFYYHFKCA